MKNSISNLGRFTAVLVALLVLAAAGTIGVSADTATPGSDQDPVVTKSYVDSAIAALKTELAASSSSGTSSSSDEYKVVHLEAYTSVIGGKNTEMILRSGEGTVWIEGPNGVSDLTGGKDLGLGDKVSLNHLLLIPQNDGRGIRVWTEAYVMIKGDYTTSAIK